MDHTLLAAGRDQFPILEGKYDGADVAHIQILLCDPGAIRGRVVISELQILAVERDYGIHLTEINQMLSAVLLEGEALKPFRLEKPIPAFRVEGASFCGKDLIIEMEDSVYRGDMYRFAAKALPERRTMPTI